MFSLKNKSHFKTKTYNRIQNSSRACYILSKPKFKKRNLASNKNDTQIKESLSL